MEKECPYPVFNYTVEYRICGTSNRILIAKNVDATTLKAFKRKGTLVRIISKREVNN